MSQILSQNEIDALLKGISGGDVDVESENDLSDSDVRVYDLTSQDRIVRGRMPTLEMLNEKFARTLRTTLSSMLRKVVNITTSSVKMVKYGEFMKTVPLPTSMHIFRMNPLRGNALFIFESRIIFTLVDILFGGTGRDSYKVEGRDFTAIENNLIRKVVLSAMTDLEKTWRSIISLNVIYQNSEINPQFVQIVVPTDVVIVINFEIEMEFSSGELILCIPYSMVEPIREKLQAGYQSDRLEIDAEWTNRFKEELRISEVNITVELGRAALKGHEIRNLKKGDVLLLDKFFSDDLSIFVEGFAKFKGQPGIYKGNQAVQITRAVSLEESHH
ncbi:MAG: flagellar motor switch protein FliM [Deltaproteobacteria bacterium]|nr:flagellar motor switch protein FliM [Deltaproteobacteria bacterium]